MSDHSEKESTKKQDPLSGMTGGLILILIGVFLLFSSLKKQDG